MIHHPKQIKNFAKFPKLWPFQPHIFLSSGHAEKFWIFSARSGWKVNLSTSREPSQRRSQSIQTSGWQPNHETIRPSTRSLAGYVRTNRYKHQYVLKQDQGITPSRAIRFVPPKYHQNDWVEQKWVLVFRKKNSGSQVNLHCQLGMGSLRLTEDLVVQSSCCLLTTTLTCR